MNEPHAERSQWLWFGAALLAMTVIAMIHAPAFVESGRALGSRPATQVA
jgi:hypothetical protein